MVVLAIVAVVTTMATFAFGRQRPRARLDSTALEMRTVLVGARQQALASGNSVVVALFPVLPTPGGGTGRIVLLEDAGGDFFSSAAAVHFDAYDPVLPVAPARGDLLDVIDLPAPVVFGPIDGLSATPLAAPTVIDVDADCTFCSSGADRRGAIRFDSAGRATFHDADGPPLALPVGASVSLTASDMAGEVRTLAVIARTGNVRSVAGHR
jgi:type II secretory pathway pseudopilin PulG